MYVELDHKLVPRKMKDINKTDELPGRKKKKPSNCFEPDTFLVKKYDVKRKNMQAVLNEFNKQRQVEKNTPEEESPFERRENKDISKKPKEITEMKEYEAVIGPDDEVLYDHDWGFFSAVLACYNNHWVLKTCPDGALDLVLPIDDNNILEGNLVHQMFARMLIQDLEEGGDNLEQCNDGRTDYIKSQIIEFGIKYSLASRFTSFVGVDEKQGKESQVMLTKQIKNQVAHGYGRMFRRSGLGCASPPIMGISRNGEASVDGVDTQWLSKGSEAAEPQGAAMPCEKDEEYYKMDHNRRGKAYIFNQMNFDPRLGLKTRNGTNKDRDNLRLSLWQLDFDVEVYNDLTFREIERILENASRIDHTDADCIFVAVLSHGELGILYSSDQPYKPDRLWNHFSADKCLTLAGKPKMFFIQACQGDQLDSGVQMVNKPPRHETDASAQTYKIPEQADILIAYSTTPGFSSWRNTTEGSWFIQALCFVLQREGFSKDLMSILTTVSRRVALDFQSNVPGDFIMHEKKQVPCIVTRLTRYILFTKKN